MRPRHALGSRGPLQGLLHAADDPAAGLDEGWEVRLRLVSSERANVASLRRALQERDRSKALAYGRRPMRERDRNEAFAGGGRQTRARVRKAMREHAMRRHSVRHGSEVEGGEKEAVLEQQQQLL